MRSRKYAITHHGVKGMKWGVRKERNTGSRRGQKSYERAANRKLDTLAAQAKTSRVLSKRDYSSLDNKSVNLGSKFYRMSSGSDLHASEVYASNNQKDRDTYKASLRAHRTTTMLPMELTVSSAKDLISPGKKERVDIFIGTLNQKVDIGGGNKKTVGDVYRTNMPQHRALNNFDLGLAVYDHFSQTQIYRTPIHTPYFDEVKKRGYSAVIDDADARWLSDTPAIIFKDAANLKVDKVHTVTAKERADARKRYVERDD